MVSRLRNPRVRVADAADPTPDPEFIHAQAVLDELEQRDPVTAIAETARLLVTDMRIIACAMQYAGKLGDSPGKGLAQHLAEFGATWKRLDRLYRDVRGPFDDANLHAVAISSVTGRSYVDIAFQFGLRVARAVYFAAGSGLPFESDFPTAAAINAGLSEVRLRLQRDYPANDELSRLQIEIEKEHRRVVEEGPRELLTGPLSIEEIAKIFGYSRRKAGDVLGALRAVKFLGKYRIPLSQMPPEWRKKHNLL